MPSSMQLLAIQGESEMTFPVARVRVALRVPASAVPNHDGAAAVLSPRDGSLECVVFDRMIFHVDGKALLVRNEARAAGDRPALHHAVEFEPQVVVQTPRGVFLDDELISLGLVCAPPRLGGHVELALPAVYLKTHRSARTPAFCRSTLERRRPCGRPLVRLAPARLGGRTAPLGLHAAAQGIHETHDIGRSRCWRRRRLLACLLGRDQLLQRGFVAVFEFGRIELGLLGLQNVLRQVEHVLRNLDVRNAVEIFLLLAHLVVVAQGGPYDAIAARREHQQPLATVEHHARNPDQPFIAHGLADDRECLVSDLVVGHEIIGLVEIELVHLLALDKGLDLDRVGAFERDFVELLLLQQDVAVAVDLIAFDAVFLRHLRSGVGVDHVVANPIAGFAVDDVETDAIARGRRREQGDATGYEREFEVALPIRTWCHDATRSPRGYRAKRRSERQVPPSIAEKARCVKDFAVFLVWSCRPGWLYLSQPVRLPPPIRWRSLSSWPNPPRPLSSTSLKRRLTCAASRPANSASSPTNCAKRPWTRWRSP